MGFEFRRPKDFLLPALLVIIDHNHDGDITNDELRSINWTVYGVLDRLYRPRPSIALILYQCNLFQRSDVHVRFNRR